MEPELEPLEHPASDAFYAEQESHSRLGYFNGTGAKADQHFPGFACIHAAEDEGVQ